jgi:UDPglucose--hexose-1-phosphate uridylyltransferase
VWKSTGKLADGREIIYFDESAGLHRAELPDRRDLSADATPAHGQGAAEAELRWDSVVGEWVVIAAQRQDRTFLPPNDECPLCPSTPGRLTEIPAPDYDVLVFENRFPSLHGVASGDSGPVARGAAGLAQPAGPGPQAPRVGPGPQAPRAAFGRCEVVCFTADHNASFAGLTPRRVGTVIEAWADRTAVLGAAAGVAQVYCFENRGEEIGVTLHHPHGQIYAFPFITPRTQQMLAQARAHAAAGLGNLFDDLLAGELADGSRIVARNEHWIAFVPVAARWPYEVMLYPAVRAPDLPAVSEAARAAFGEVYLDVLRRLDALFGIRMPYIAAWHQAPGTDPFARREFGLHLQVISVRRAAGKLKYLAGTESGMGVWINDVTPEAAAKSLREAR